jgi:crotonobetainyl-CoA:carnitine CoA-transferase CaiB-like acyl-CoA transferase
VPRTAEIDAAIQSWCSTQTIDTALQILAVADVPVGKIYSVRDMMSDPQFIAREMFEQHAFTDGTPVKLPAISPKLSVTPGQTLWLGPKLGQHNAEVLQSLGYSQAEIDQMHEDKII